jgi:hypothetical protein
VISGDITSNIPLREFYTLLQCISNPMESGSGYGELPARASLYYLKDNKAIDYVENPVFHTTGFSQIVLTHPIPKYTNLLPFLRLRLVIFAVLTLYIPNPESIAAFKERL